MAIQSNTAHNDLLDPGDTGDVEFDDPQLENDTNLVWIWNDTSTTAAVGDIESITDTAGNDYVVLAAVSAAGGLALYLGAAIGIKSFGAGNVVTFKLSASAASGFYDSVIVEAVPCSEVLFAVNSDYGMGPQVPNASVSGTKAGEYAAMMMSDGNGTGISTLGAFGSNPATAIYVPDPNGDEWMIQEGVADGSDPILCTAGVSDDFWVAIVAILKESTVLANALFYGNNF